MATLAPLLPRQPVESSSLASVGYDPAAETMDVEFVTGAVYRYFEVPPTVHAQLLHAESLGAHFNAKIRPVFAYVRLLPGDRDRDR